MRFRLLAIFLGLLLAVSAAAQSSPQTSTTSGTQATSQSGPVMIVQVIAGRAKSGSEAQYIEGRKRHMEWHRAQNDAWTWHVYEVITGKNTGSLVTVSSPHRWADRDSREQFVRDDQADVARTIVPHAEPHQFSLWRIRSDMGRAGAPKPADAPTAYATVQHFFLHADAMPAYVENIKKLGAALDKINQPGPKGVWYQLLNGGEGPHFVLVTPRKNWADFEGPQQTLDEAARQALGSEGATLMSNIRKAIRHTESEALRHNNDLSYHPAAKK